MFMVELREECDHIGYRSPDFVMDMSYSVLNNIHFKIWFYLKI